MKKFILLSMLALVIGIATQAQRVTTLPLAAGDTIVNTGTASKVLPVITAGFEGAIVQVNLSKISGTGAGTTGLYGSLDGVTYTQIGSNYTITNTATQAAYFSVAAPLPAYLKVLSTGSGTESVKQTVLYVLRRHD